MPKWVLYAAGLGLAVYLWWRSRGGEPTTSLQQQQTLGPPAGSTTSPQAPAPPMGPAVTEAGLSPCPPGFYRDSANLARGGTDCWPTGAYVPPTTPTPQPPPYVPPASNPPGNQPAPPPPAPTPQRITTYIDAAPGFDVTSSRRQVGVGYQTAPESFPNTVNPVIQGKGGGRFGF